MLNKIIEFFGWNPLEERVIKKRISEIKTKLIQQGYTVNVDCSEDGLISIKWATSQMQGHNLRNVTKYDLLEKIRYDELLKRLF